MSRILVITALRQETRTALAALKQPRRVRAAASPSWQGRAGPHEVRVIQGGVGFEAALRAASSQQVAAPVSDSCEVIVSLGFAGALVPGLGPGDFVLSPTVLWDENGRISRYDVSQELCDTLETALPSEVLGASARGTLLSSPVVLATPASKEQAARRYGAVAVEMESAALAGHAAEHGIPFLPLRVILDGVDLSLENLPRNLDTSWRARASLLGMPAIWPLIGALRRNSATASATLTKVAAAVLPALAGVG